VNQRTNLGAMREQRCDEEKIVPIASATETRDINGVYSARDMSRDTPSYNEPTRSKAQPDDTAHDGFLAYETDCLLLENVLAGIAHTELEYQTACEWLEVLPNELPQIAPLSADAAYAWLDCFLHETAHDGSWNNVEALCASLEDSWGDTAYDGPWDFEAAYAWLYGTDVHFLV
jgi:hypothetical protein